MLIIIVIIMIQWIVEHRDEQINLREAVECKRQQMESLAELQRQRRHLDIQKRQYAANFCPTLQNVRSC